MQHSNKGESGATKTKKRKGKKKKRAEKPVVLSLEKVTALIGKLYCEKAKSDYWIAKKEEEVAGGAGGSGGDGSNSASTRKRPSLINPKSLKKLRFDAFIMRHFKSQHGTRGIARRHLRNFVVSVQHLACHSERVQVFRKLAGIPKLDGSSEPYIPSLVVRYFLPMMISVFGSPEQIGKR